MRPREHLEGDTVGPEPKLKLIGWSSDELYVKVDVDGREQWVPVDGPCDDWPEGVCRIRGRRYRIGGTRLLSGPAPKG